MRVKKSGQNNILTALDDLKNFEYQELLCKNHFPALREVAGSNPVNIDSA
jgi:hypothetical protein